MKPSPVSPKWRKRRQKMAEELKRRGEIYFKTQKSEKRKNKEEPLK